jgi:agmatinase
MYNALSEHLADQLCIVGLRDYCHAEAAMIEEDPRITVHTDRAMNEQLFSGSNWAEVTSKIVTTLPQQVYLSVDIDGLDPALCPGTGTPVPGGLSMGQFLHLIDAVVASGRKIIGADLVEVVPGENQWDANVGARVLYALSHRLS